jgi:hypothetical protein
MRILYIPIEMMASAQPLSVDYGGLPPTTLRIETQLYENGPIWRKDSASPTWEQQNQTGQKAFLKRPALDER